MAAWRPCPPPPGQPLASFPKAGPAAVGEVRWDLEAGNVVFWGAGAKLQRALCMLSRPSWCFSRWVLSVRAVVMKGREML